MPNIAQVLKAEICRLAKKEARAQTAKLRRDVVRLKKSNVAQRRAIALLQQDSELLMASEKRRQQSGPIAPEAKKARITAKGIRAMRRKLGLSQAEYGKLVGVSAISVGTWERKSGALRIKGGTRAAILALRGVGAREAKRRVELMRK